MRSLAYATIVAIVTLILAGCASREGKVISSVADSSQPVITVQPAPAMLSPEPTESTYGSESAPVAAYRTGAVHPYASAPPVYTAPHNEAYAEIYERGFTSVASAPLSTFSIDVDTGSYSNLRRMIEIAWKPPVNAVRIEEMVNYFEYDYAPPSDKTPFAVDVDTARCPWAEEHVLMRVGLKGQVMDDDTRPAANLVFLIDVSGSMQDFNKLPIVKSALKLLVQRLNERDRVAIVTYAGSAGVALESIRVNERNRVKILQAIDNLEGGGSTHGSAGIARAYKVAAKEFRKDDVNRVILATDGDFNVGVTSLDDLLKLIETEAKGGVFLNVLGFGMGNYKDATAEQLANHGNGIYAYIDSMIEARKVFVNQLVSNLVTIAKDVKIQVEFNPAAVAGYRLLGYAGQSH
jgi:Ca-activated chloride channel family protein